MKPLESLTYRGQFRRYRRFAERALSNFPLDAPQLTSLTHGENTTFRVDAKQGRFLFRIHRAGYHTRPEIESELAWLCALDADLGVGVPVPIPNAEGELVSRATMEGIGTRDFVVFRWVNGRFLPKRFAAKRFREVGRVMAQLHAHARSFEPPKDFVRPRWDADALTTGSVMGGGLELIVDEHRALFGEVCARLLEDIRALETPDAVGLIHADFHHGNYLFDGSSVRAIDFDDCGFGHFGYDLAVALQWFRYGSRYDEIRTELFRGYREIRPLSVEIEASVETFAIARMIVITFWVAGRTDNPYFAERLKQQLPSTADQLARWMRGEPAFP